MEMSVDIINQGEDAFNAMLYLQLPKEVNYNGVENTNPGLSVLCSPPSPMNNRTLQCDVGNPLPSNTKVSHSAHWSRMKSFRSEIISIEILSKDTSMDLVL